MAPGAEFQKAAFGGQPRYGEACVEGCWVSGRKGHSLARNWKCSPKMLWPGLEVAESKRS